MKQKTDIKYFVRSIVLLITFFIFKSYYSILIPISGDEAYHWEWSRHLALGYYDHPPMVGWVISVTRALGRIVGGPELFWTRLPALLSITGILIIAYRLLVKTTGKKRLGFYGILLLGVTPLFALGGNIITTDQPLIFFSGLTIYLLYQALFEDRDRYWYYAGLAAGCAFLSKFLSILIIPGILLFLILSPPDRAWLRRKQPYLAALIAALVYLPNIVWNARYDWATYKFNLTSRHQSAFSLEKFAESVAGQLGVIGPILFPLLLIGLAYACWRGFKDQDRRALFFSLIPLFVLVFLGLIGFFRTVGAHWSALAYLPATVAFFYIYRDKFDQINLKSIGWWALHTGLVLSLILTVIIHLLPVYAHLIPEQFELAGNEVEVDHTDLGPLYGWEELGQQINQLQEDYDEEIFFISPSYAFSSLSSFNTPGHPFVRVYGSGSVYGQNYKYWNNYQDLEGKDAVFLYKELSDSYFDKLNDSFEEVRQLESLEIENPAGNYVRTFYFIYCEGFDGSDWQEDK
ncbi:MAG: ArnT family glycosyltransferase [Bacillota bacterium]